MDFKSAIEFIETAGKQGSKPGLSRIGELCSLLGNPQKGTRFVHIAGTNGKGSVSAMLDSVLRHAGYKTGLFTSPHLCRFNERIRVDGRDIPDPRLAKAIGRIKTCFDKMSDKPTEFEIVTAAAFLYFAEEQCDIVVLETGLGGRLDATNIITDPVLSVITGISLDHTAVLGDTEEQIAYEKAGIIKENRPVVLADCDSRAAEVLENAAKEKMSPIFKVNYKRLENTRVFLCGTEFSFSPYGDIKLSLSGVYQAHNACAAITAAEALIREGYKITEEDIKGGLNKVRWPARFEVLSKSPLIIYDGAHNPQGAQALKENLKAVNIKKAVFLSGVMADKDYNLFAKTLSPFAKGVFTVSPDSPRALDPEKLADVFGSFGVKTAAHSTVADGVAAAVKFARTNNLPLIICGSLYMYADIKSAL